MKPAPRGVGRTISTGHFECYFCGAPVFRGKASYLWRHAGTGHTVCPSSDSGPSRAHDIVPDLPRSLDRQSVEAWLEEA